MTNIRRNNKSCGFSLVEVLVSIVVLTVLMGVFKTLFLDGFRTMDDSMIRSQLQIDAGFIADRLSVDAREAGQFTIINDENTKTLILSNSDGTNTAQYTITSANQISDGGTLSVTYDFVTEEILSHNVDFEQSNFILIDSRFVRFNLVLENDTFDRRIAYASTIENFIRN